ncbi:MAG: hypothetical protein ABT01_01630 [Clostridium sp. SCN 57-10]|nr:MAG: hypothetical protein ABT01_01630 [Clostridium sp. SCN 57-10]
MRKIVLRQKADNAALPSQCEKDSTEDGNAFPSSAGGGYSARRYPLFDALRGFSIVLMVLYHCAYLLVTLGHAPSGLIENPVLYVLQPLFASVFIAISGACSVFSRNNARRGIKFLLAAAVITLASWLFMPDLIIRFGILHFLGVMTLAMAPLRPWLMRRRARPMMWLALFFVSYFALNRTFSIEHLWLLGIVSPGFVSGDFFPLFPWSFMYFFGTCIGRAAQENRLPAWFYTVRMPFFEACGRHTLLIYLLHLPIFYAIVQLVFALIA